MIRDNSAPSMVTEFWVLCANFEDEWLFRIRFGLRLGLFRVASLVISLLVVLVVLFRHDGP